MQNYSIEIAKKEIVRAIVNELYSREVLKFEQYNKITHIIDNELVSYKRKIDEQLEINNVNSNLVVDIQI